MQTIFRRSGSNSQKTKCLDIININLFMLLLVEEIAIYFEAHTKDTNSLFEQNKEFCSLKNFVHTVRGKSPIMGGGVS